MKKKLKIAVWHNLPSGGGKRQLFNHIKGLLERGHSIESWCPDTADQTFLPLNELVTEHIVPLIFPKNFNRQSLEDIVKSHENVKTLAGALDAHNQECARQINDNDFDVLFANACTFFRATSIGKYVRIPSALYIGEPYRWFYEAMPELAWLPKHEENLGNDDDQIFGVRLQARKELTYARAFNLLLVNSIYSRETILRVYNLESKVCYLGIDTDFYRPTTTEKKGFVVGVGTIYHAKGVDRAIKALASIDKKNRPDLVWIGNGALRSDLEKYIDLAEKLDVTLSVKLNISHDEVKSLLSQASLMLFTSRLEPFGIAPLEANACGTAVVGIAEGGVRETIQDGINGYLFKDDSPELIGAMIVELLNDKKRLHALGKTAREHVVAKWNIENCTSNIERYLYFLKETGSAASLKSDVKGISFSASDNTGIQMSIVDLWKNWIKRLLPQSLRNLLKSNKESQKK